VSDLSSGLTSDLTILGRVTSINARNVLWTADLIGLAYRHEAWGLPDRDPRAEEFTRLNPNAQVPVILEGDFVLWESNAIMRYFADRHRSGLFPTEPHERALVDQWLTWQATELPPVWNYAVQALLRKNPGYADQTRISESIESWTNRMQILERQLDKGGGFVANGRTSLADIALVLSVHRWFQTPFEKVEFPTIDAYYEMFSRTDEGRKYLGQGTP